MGREGLGFGGGGLVDLFEALELVVGGGAAKNGHILFIQGDGATVAFVMPYKNAFVSRGSFIGAVGGTFVWFEDLRQVLRREEPEWQSRDVVAVGDGEGVYDAVVILYFPVDGSNLGGMQEARDAFDAFLRGLGGASEVVEVVGHAVGGMIVNSDEKGVSVVAMVVARGGKGVGG